MSFEHLAGVTTPAAPDEVIDWFTQFEAWMLTVGWTVAAGTGTQDIFFQSVGELGGLTMLFIHVWRDPGFPNRIRFEVCDDAVPTHETGEAGYIDTGGVPFAFWCSGDMDAIVACSKVGAGYGTIYVGMVIPFALTITDETYCMIATSWIGQGSILRDFDNVWDVDHQLYDSVEMDDNVIDPIDGSITLAGTYLNQFADIAGQLRHISAEINDPGLNPEDTITTGRPGATTEWIVMSDLANRTQAVRTGGILPVGVPDGAFASVNGVAGNWAALQAAISAFAIGRGWTDLGDPGYYGGTEDGAVFHSAGESGLENIFVGFSWVNGAPGALRSWISDDFVGTHRIYDHNEFSIAEFPVNYWISGDADCLILVMQRAVGYNLNWTGLTLAFAPGVLPPPEQSIYAVCTLACGWPTWATHILRHHSTLAWVPAANIGWDGAPAMNSNPNSFDGTTYLIWPIHSPVGIAGGNYPHGQYKYIGFTSGGGVASMDTITIAGQVYTVFIAPAGNPFPPCCMRTL